MKILKYILILFIAAGVKLVYSQYTLQNAFPNLTFSFMTDLGNAHDGTNRIFVVTQRGIIYVFPDTSIASNPKVFLDLSNEVTQSGSETGLLSITFHPAYTSNRYFFVDYTTSSSPLTEVVSRFTTSASNPDSALRSSELVIMSDPKPFGYTNHNGGKLNFGPDGYLYISRGDGGSEGDPNHTGQDRTVIWGKMLRIDINTTSGGNNYSIPPTNPYYQNSNGYRQEIWAYGLRNPWRFSFDPVTGVNWCGDVGQNTWEEVDRIYGGKNYGWSTMEGFACYNPANNCDSNGITIPIWVYQHLQGNCSVTGGYVYHGALTPNLAGKYIYGDYCTGMMWALTYDSINGSTNQFLLSAGFPVGTFGVDQNNELYVCKYNNAGQIYKFNPYPIGIRKEGEDVPSEFFLYQNYPNPFNPSTRIKFDIPSDAKAGNAQNVKLEIFNYTGQRIATLLDSRLPAGTYEYSWDGSKYSTGIYIYKLTVGNIQISKKMAVIK